MNIVFNCSIDVHNGIIAIVQVELRTWILVVRSYEHGAATKKRLHITIKVGWEPIAFLVFFKKACFTACPHK